MPNNGRRGDKRYRLTGYFQESSVREYIWSWSESQAKLLMKRRLAKRFGIDWIFLENERIQDITPKAETLTS